MSINIYLSLITNCFYDVYLNDTIAGMNTLLVQVSFISHEAHTDFGIVWFLFGPSMPYRKNRHVEIFFLFILLLKTDDELKTNLPNFY